MSSNFNMELEGDGFIENLYHYLWSKDSIFNRSPSVNLPDTVVYRYEQPVFWYFTMHQQHQVEGSWSSIMRKSRKKLTNQEIERVFLKDESQSGVIAVYMYKRQERNIVNVMKR